PCRRGAAAEALCRAGAADQLPSVRKLLQDPVPAVRLQAALALANAKEKDAVPVLIDLLPKLTQAQAWRVEDVLFRLASGKTPPAVSLGGDETTRKKCSDAWAKWWKENGAKIDLAKLAETPALRGYTLVVLLDQNVVRELWPDGQPRW